MLLVSLIGLLVSGITCFYMYRVSEDLRELETDLSMVLFDGKESEVNNYENVGIDLEQGSNCNKAE